MKVLYMIAALFISFQPARAQEKFIGTIEYKIVLFKADKSGDEQPEKVIMAYGKDKMAMWAYFADKPDEFYIINTLIDSVYMNWPENKKYMKESLINKGPVNVMLEKTDSFKTYFGYRCRGYRVKAGPEQKENYGYVWTAEDLTGIQLKDNYQHMMLQISGAPNVMLSADIYFNDTRIGTYIPVDMKKMTDVPDSLFDLTGYTQMEGSMLEGTITDSTKMVMPADDQPVADTGRMAPVPRKIKPVKKTPPVKKPFSPPKAKTAAITTRKQ